MKKICFHCGLDVPPDLNLPILYEGREEPSCCAGCQAVAQSIIDAGLGKYYEERTAEAQRGELPPQEILEQLKLYDLPEVQADFVEVKSENEREALLMLSGITCAACVWLIEQRLMRLSGVVRVDLNYGTHRARVAWDASRLNLSQILLLIRQTGYEAHPYDAMKVEAQAQKERKQALLRLWVAGLSMMQVMMYAVPTYLFGDIEPQFLWLLHWANMVLTLPVVLFSAVPFYRGAIRDLKNRRVGMDTPIALAVSLAFIASTIALLRREEGGVFFDSVSMFVFLLLGGRYLEQMARSKAAYATERLVKLVPAFCHRLPDYPHERTVQEAAVVQVEEGDVLLVKAGEVIPADGEVLDGESEVNEAMLTGESLPVGKRAGDKVTAGTTNTASPLIMRVLGVGTHTRLGSIVRLLDTALAQKPRMAQIADRYASVFVAALLSLAVLIFAFWTWHADANRALWVTVSLLVITCPCALSLATPAALTAGTGNLTASGMLVSSGAALETLAHVDDVIFDKTGTLTEGKLRVSAVGFDGQNATDSGSPGQLPACYADIVCALEAQSEHPIALALLEQYRATANAVMVENVINTVGQGIAAQIDGEVWRLGRIAYVAQIAGNPPSWAQRTHDGTMVALGNVHGFQAAFYLADTIKDNAAATVKSLNQMGLRTHLLSGDMQTAAQTVAEKLAIQNVTAEASPEEKLAYVQSLQRQGRKVLMVGDGVNDAPVLAQADVSVAMAGGADVSREGSDMVMMNRDLRILPRSLKIARKTQHIIRQNLAWALTYNAIAVPIAAMGYAKPVVAALGMAASSLLVVSNALRLLRAKV
ncbi:MAG: heavy metal translocating P-type ATPase [Neisseria sp.]|nr:heavy metal translocating P-type ATPase [Neisseria sp.]